MDKKYTYIILIIIVVFVSGCSLDNLGLSKKEKFIKHLKDDYSFTCSQDNSSCTRGTKEEDTRNGVNRYYNRSETFIFYKNRIQLEYSNILSYNGISSGDEWSAYYDYKHRMSGVNMNGYSYDCEKSELKLESGANNKLNCRTTTNYNTKEICNAVENKCKQAYATYTTYISGYDVNDIIE